MTALKAVAEPMFIRPIRMAMREVMMMARVGMAVLGSSFLGVSLHSTHFGKSFFGMLWGITKQDEKRKRGGYFCDETPAW